MMDDRGPAWGGYPGTDTRPRRLGGDGTAVGDTSQAAASATITSDKSAPEGELLSALKARVLKEKKTAEPVSGLLYFHLEGKHKPKQLELLYNTPKGKLAVRFQ